MAKAPEKSDGAFRTIREVADWLGVPTHVLRFWESKFDQIAPVKGAGGRRYYRPEDMRLLGGIKVMLHDQGLTIRAVGQKIEDDGVDPVMALSPEVEMPEGPPARTRRVIRQGDEPATEPVASKATPTDIPASEETSANEPDLSEPATIAEPTDTPVAEPDLETEDASEARVTPGAALPKSRLTPVSLEEFPDEAPTEDGESAAPTDEAPSPSPDTRDNTDTPEDSAEAEPIARDTDVDADQTPQPKPVPVPDVPNQPDDPTLAAEVPEQPDAPSPAVEAAPQTDPVPAQPVPTVPPHDPHPEPAAASQPALSLRRAREQARGAASLDDLARRRLRRLVRRYRALAEEIREDLDDSAQK
ncbi:hypothetical protein JANAI62_00320 [Jannaschia pagri]|uniref:HTH merR-type domain-containing protein n=1 Tax=Jannaschia pagri TaxID=2829797 RepID=A0ABQ4NG55_9RHOB|nr:MULTISPECIES: MerR family transcriptional regulator [unclassified Jannaschia]GIT90486.1 hypothetical protein JANAI61_09440 [Jannaschia sp. AI_61]GIT93409.1 hypothetical protein JANAI62_00320 [Jannaschia sp. AI_62]